MRLARVSGFVIVSRSRCGMQREREFFHLNTKLIYPRKIKNSDEPHTGDARGCGLIVIIAAALRRGRLLRGSILLNQCYRPEWPTTFDGRVNPVEPAISMLYVVIVFRKKY